jgi:hypothetical protein
MSPDGKPAVAASAAKAGAVWVGVGFGHTQFSWADLAAILAAMYSAILIGEWLWKRAIRPAMVRIGWAKPRSKQQPPEDETTDRAAL